jgi:hypothetical protein
LAPPRPAFFKRGRGFAAVELKGIEPSASRVRF